jgi:hypothetical protein
MNVPDEIESSHKNNLFPDTSFKAVTLKLAKEFGLETVGAEFQQTTIADLVLHVPDDKKESLENTTFHFFRSYNVVEFKSLSDKFTPLLFLDNVVRTCLFQQQKSEVPFNKILNVYVIAFYPREFFKQMRLNKCYFKRDKEYKWLYWGNVAGHDVVIVVGRYLPLEKPYYHWLLFAQSTIEKLQEFAKILYKEGETELLQMLVRLKPKEVKTVITEIRSDRKKIIDKELRKDYNDLAKELIAYMREAGYPDEEIMVLFGITPERILATLSPEEILANLTAKDIVAKLSPKEIIAELTPKEIIAELTPKEIIAELTPKEIIAELTPKEIIAELTPKEIIAELSPQELKELADLIAKKQQETESKE